MVYLVPGAVYLDKDNPMLSYTVVITGPPHTSFGSTYQLNPTLSFDDNIIALWQQVVKQSTDNAITPAGADLGGFGVRSVTDADLAKEIATPDSKVADASTETQPTMMARMMDSLRSMWS